MRECGCLEAAAGRSYKARTAGDVQDLGTSGYEVREDVIGLSVVSSDIRKIVKGG